MLETETKTCAYCGSAVLCEAGQAAEDVCECPDAKRKREAEIRFYKLRRAIENCCGEDCGTLYPELSPLRAEELSAMIQIIEMVCYDLCLSASVSLPDDTSLRITPDAVERKRTIKRKEKIS